MIPELGLKIIKAKEDGDDKCRSVVALSPFLYLKVLITLLMCGAYLTFVNPPTVQVKSPTFFPFELGNA